MFIRVRLLNEISNLHEVTMRLNSDKEIRVTSFSLVFIKEPVGGQ